MIPAYTSVRTTFVQISDELTESGVKLFRGMRIWLPIGIFGFCLAVWLPVSVRYVQELSNLTALLLALPKHLKR
jgi:hypothetical protein